MHPSLTDLDERALDRLFAKFDDQVPGAAVSVAIRGRPVYRKGFGLAHLELPVTLTPSMRMRIGSTTKHFTCLAFMLLCEQGKADIDDPIEKHIPEINPVAHGVTMRQLMGHTSGLRDSLSLSMSIHGTAAPITHRDLVAWYETIDDVEFIPGSAWQYNNGAYVLLAAAIERIGGRPLDEQFREAIFEPLAMTSTRLRRWEHAFVANSATLHMVDPDGRFTRDYFGFEITGEGGLVSTMDDMLIWLRHMDAPTVGSLETWRLMREPHRLQNGCSTGYGLGLITSRYRGREVVWHSGGVMGGNSQMIKVPSAGLDISIATNRQDVSAAELACRIIDVVVKNLDEVPEPKPARTAPGFYASSTSGRVVEVQIRENGHFLAIDGAPGMPVQEDAGRLKLKSDHGARQIAFACDDDSGSLIEFGNEDPMTRVLVDETAPLEPLVGRYGSATLGACAEVTEDEEGRHLILSGRFGSAAYELIAVSGTIWSARPQGVWPALGAMVTFVDGGRGLRFAADAIRPVLFTRTN